MKLWEIKSSCIPVGIVGHLQHVVQRDSYSQGSGKRQDLTPCTMYMYRYLQESPDHAIDFFGDEVCVDFVTVGRRMDGVGKQIKL